MGHVTHILRVYAPDRKSAVRSAYQYVDSISENNNYVDYSTVTGGVEPNGTVFSLLIGDEGLSAKELAEKFNLQEVIDYINKHIGTYADAIKELNELVANLDPTKKDQSLLWRIKCAADKLGETPEPGKTFDIYEDTVFPDNFSEVGVTEGYYEGDTYDNSKKNAYFFFIDSHV